MEFEMISRATRTVSSARTPSMLALAAGLVGLSVVATSMAIAQASGAQSGGATPAAPSAASGNPARDNLIKLQRPVSFDLNESKLEDVIKFFSETTGATFEPLWKGPGADDGLDKETQITLSVKNLDALTALEKVLDLAAAAGGGFGGDSNTWQFTEYGAIQLGSRKLLNKFKRTAVYDVNDLLFVIPVYDDVPEIDLAQALQGGGGGGGRSPFQGGGSGGNEERRREREERREERLTELKGLVTSLTETEQWEDGGGDGGKIVTYEGHFIVKAPDYMHRALVGYPWWPSTTNNAQRSRRFVSTNVSTSNTGIGDVVNFPVTATPGGPAGPAR
jgi:hypothetical protein